MQQGFGCDCWEQAQSSAMAACNVSSFFNRCCYNPTRIGEKRGSRAMGPGPHWELTGRGQLSRHWAAHSVRHPTHQPANSPNSPELGKSCSVSTPHSAGCQVWKNQPPSMKITLRINDPESRIGQGSTACLVPALCARASTQARGRGRHTGTKPNHKLGLTCLPEPHTR